MKFLEMHELGRLSSMLTDCVLGDQMLNGRIEAYSCKKAGDDKKLSKQLQQKFKRRKRSGTFTLLAGTAVANGLGFPDAPSTSSYSNSTAGAAALATGQAPRSSSLSKTRNNSNASMNPAPIDQSSPSHDLNLPEPTSNAKRIPSSGESRAGSRTVSNSVQPVAPAAPSSGPSSPERATTVKSNAHEKPNGSTSGLLLEGTAASTSSSPPVFIQVPKRTRALSNSGLQRQGSIHSFESEGLIADGIEAHASDLSMDVSNSSSLGEDISANASTRKVVIDLISTLNAMHEDYDFSDAGADRFVKHSSFTAIIPAINKNLAEVVELRNEGFLNTLWAEVDKAINVRQCDVFSYLPTDGDPFVGRGVLWSFNYFFYNSELHRVLCFTCIATSKWNQVRSRTPGRLGNRSINGFDRNGGDSDDFLSRNGSPFDDFSPPASPGGRSSASDLANLAEQERLRMLGFPTFHHEARDEENDDGEEGYDVADLSDPEDDDINS